MITFLHGVVAWRNCCQIAEFKALIEKQEDLPADSQKIIHSGKILKDTQTCDSAGIKDKDFVVCMVGRSRPVWKLLTTIPHFQL